MKDYLSGLVDLTGDAQINPGTLDFGDGEGSHGRSVGNITSISIHHDAQFRPHDYDSVDRYVAQATEDGPRLGPGLPYHYRVDNTGVIFACRPLTTWLNCVRSSENPTTVAICLDGNFQPGVAGVPEQRPTLEQCEGLFQLLKYLCTQRPDFPATWPNVRPHRDFSQTACPGDNEAPYVYAIQDEATALRFPPNEGYDWPEYQPSVVSAVAAPKPTSTPLATPAAAPPPPVSPAPTAPSPPSIPPTAAPSVHAAPPVPSVPKSSPLLPPKPQPSIWQRILKWLHDYFFGVNS